MAVRPRHLARVARLLVGSIRQLENWNELLRGTLKEMFGWRVGGAPILRFRNGLEIALVSGGYGGYYILFREIFVEQCYRPTPRFTIRPGWRVLDIGANMGIFTCQASNAAKGVRVVAVEPVRSYVDKLHENIERNGFEKTVVFHAAAVGRATDAVPITTWFTRTGEPKVTASVPPGRRTETETVVGMTLAEILAKGGLARCDLMKMDIEGWEYAILDATPAEIWGKIDRIVMETHEVEGRTEGELVDVLREQGYEVGVRRGYLWATRAGLEP